MFHRVVFAVFASLFAASAVPPAEVPTNAYLAAGVYAGAELKGFTARDAQPLYTDGLKPGCPNAAGVDAALATGPASGNGVLLGTDDGRIVVSESIHAFGNAKAAKKFVTKSRASSGCLGLAGRDSMNRVFVQYPQLPPLPTFARESSRDATTVFTTFEGTSDPAPLVGATALTRWGGFVAETSVRIAAPKPGELDPLLRNLLASVVSNGRSATGP